MEEKRKSENFFETLKDNPKEVLKWAFAEIREYQNLIKIIKKSLYDNKRTNKTKIR